MNSRDKVAENLSLLAMAGARARGADSDAVMARDAVLILSYLVADMIGPDGELKNLAFRAALCAGGAK